MSNRSFRGARLIHFSDFELDIRAAELRRNGIHIRLQEQPFRILAALLEKPGDVVTRLGLKNEEEIIPLVDIDTIYPAPLDGMSIDE